MQPSSAFSLPLSKHNKTTISSPVQRPPPPPSLPLLAPLLSLLHAPPPPTRNSAALLPCEMNFTLKAVHLEREARKRLKAEHQPTQAGSNTAPVRARAHHKPPPRPPPPTPHHLPALNVQLVESSEGTLRSSLLERRSHTSLLSSTSRPPGWNTPPAASVNWSNWWRGCWGHLEGGGEGGGEAGGAGMMMRWWGWRGCWGHLEGWVGRGGG